MLTFSRVSPFDASGRLHFHKRFPEIWHFAGMAKSYQKFAAQKNIVLFFLLYFSASSFLVRRFKYCDITYELLFLQMENTAFAVKAWKVMCIYSSMILQHRSLQNAFPQMGLGELILSSCGI